MWLFILNNNFVSGYIIHLNYLFFVIVHGFIFYGFICFV